MKKKSLKVGVLGAAGRMGQEIGALLTTLEGVEPFLGVDSAAKIPGFKNSAKKAEGPLAADVDVWIDFSSPEGLEKFLALPLKEPLVSGTTGISEKHKKALEKAGRKRPVLWASNMSVGVALLSKAMEVLSDAKGFDFQIEEFHHRHKKDKPSGTAITLQQKLNQVIGEKAPEPLAIRGGGIFGVHKVWAMSEEETLLFEHTALNRRVFASGAIRAAKWIVNQRPGVYRISDLFNHSRKS